MTLLAHRLLGARQTTIAMDHDRNNTHKLRVPHRRGLNTVHPCAIRLPGLVQVRPCNGVRSLYISRVLRRHVLERI